MNSLKVPEAGLTLEGPSAQVDAIPSQAFALTLSGDVVANLIKAARGGDGLQLALGKTPTLHYGSKSHRISPPQDSFPYDLYLTRPFDSSRTAGRLPLTTDLFTKPKPPDKSQTGKEATTKSKSAVTSKTLPSGLDSDIEALQNGLAENEARKARAQMIERAPDKKRASAKAKGKLLSGYGSNPPSLPTSPGRNGHASPAATSAPSASQVAVERAKDQRKSLVHELAVKEQTMEHLRDRWTGKDEDFRPALEKVADCAPDSKLWNMKKVYWKELDVWNYDYDTEAERQKAIDNAVRQFDRQRLSASEPEWQKLLPKEERGKGKCLSRLQTTLAKGPAPAAPKIKVQKADDGSGSKHDGDNLGGKTGGESMSRSSSSNGPSKPKKPSAADAQAKRLLGSSKAKTASSKTSPSKGKVGGSKTNGNPPLSQEYVYDSDSSGEETSLAKPAPKEDVVKDTVVVTTKPPAKALTKEQPAKRPHEDDDSSSSSGTPLAKRHKQRPTPQPSKLKEREAERERDRERERERERRREQPAEPKQKSRGPATTSTARPKNTSPTKSSPLASSPPTNASDMETDRAPVAKKRKAELEMKPATVKRRAPSRVSLEVMTKANKFKEYYQKYQTLHRQIADLDNPPDEKVANLLNMRGRLVNMKKEIYRECSPV